MNCSDPVCVGLFLDSPAVVGYGNRVVAGDVYTVAVTGGTALVVGHPVQRKRYMDIGIL